MVPHVVENQVVSLPAFGEILPGVIDDAVRAEGLHHARILRAADAGHLCAERLAICTANVPTPPPAPLISTLCPAESVPYREDPARR
jgi:hypothetical protein